VKRNSNSLTFILAAITFFLCAASPLTAYGANLGSEAADQGFSVKEYEHFHAVLHPLEHDALPKNDFKTIRARAGDLVTLGEAIVELGVPRGVKEQDTAEFKEWLGKFDQALVKFKADAKSGTDDQLKESYSAVHDSFEMLAAMLPKK
jgi:hypothetical protein